ncbi:hypothetical protein LC653_24105 [Nostoc sp. CHAB 5784]|uniref:hypothetical protein n=1 Tax=Nostoc mirabile TaxID=2907820 RepID=UPI001E621078|nr:hypothetical protein [Nostoc mirabile]MCC5666892.1 hypothetical protein [Nostoc mirabile CHAB5784]
MPSATTSQAIENSPYRQEETQSYELQEWEGYSWVIFCLKVKSDRQRRAVTPSHFVSEAVRSFAQPNSNW